MFFTRWVIYQFLHDRTKPNIYRNGLEALNIDAEYYLNLT